MPALLHYDFHPHPGVDAALEIMFPFRQAGDLNRAPLQHSGPGYLDFVEAAGTFGNYSLSRPIQLWDEAAAKLRDLGEGMRLADCASANRSFNVVNAPSEMFLQKSGPSA